MIKNTYMFAGIPVEIIHFHPYMSTLCSDYLTDQVPYFIIEITESNIDQERKNADGQYSDGYLESLAFYRKFCDRAANENIVLLHSCAIEFNGKAYLFAAPSGTGKSTHAALWLDMLGCRAHIINGDKPLLRISENSIIVYGTPWDGKEHWSTNSSAPVAGICFLSRGKENTIRKLHTDEVLPMLLSQVYRPKCAEGLSCVMTNILRISHSVPMYDLSCNMTLKAAELSFKTMSGEYI